MRRLVTADWQLADGSRDRYRLDFVVKTLPKLIDKYNVDQLLVLGDLTEEKDNHPATLVNDIVGLFAFLARKCRVIVLQGNHDFLHKGYPFFQFLEQFKTISWIDKPSEIDNCLYLPHTRDYKTEWKDINFDDKDFIFAHNIFEGVKANGQSLSGIPRSIFPDGSFVISGDVHEPQSLDPVTYVGSPCLCDFGDSYQPRVLLLDDLKVKSIKVYGQQKRLIQIECLDKGFLPPEHTANAGDIVKIQAHLKMEQVAQWADLRKGIEDWAIANKFIVNTIQPQVAYVIGERQKILKNSSKKSDLQYLDSFVKRSGIDERTADIGKELI